MWFCERSSRCVAQAADVLGRLPVFASSCLGHSEAGAAVSAAQPRLIGIFGEINSIAFNNAKHSAEPQRDRKFISLQSLVYSVPLKKNLKNNKNIFSLTSGISQRELFKDEGL